MDHIIRSRHPNPFGNISEAQWARHLENLKKNAPIIPEKEIVVALCKTIALLNDGHTFLDFDKNYGFDRWFPVRFYDFDDGVYITVAHPKYQNLIGKKVQLISGLPAGDVLNIVTKAISGDNVFHKRNIATAFLSNATLLEALGVIGENQDLSVQFVAENGKIATTELAAVASFYSTNYRNWGELFGPPLDDYDTYITPFEQGKPPLNYREFSDKAPPFYASREPFWFKNYPEYSSFLFQFNFAAEIGPESFEDFRNRLRNALEAAKPEKLIVDVRYNFGGDGSMMVPLVNDLIAFNKSNPKTHLYVLLGRQTFSAGIMLVARLEEYLDVTLVGEPAGAGYNHYGDPVTYKLPNSGLKLHCSSVFWQLGHPLDDSEVIPVEFPITVTATDFFNGQDTAFQKIVKHNDLRHLSDVFLEEDVASAQAIYESRDAVYRKIPWWNPIPEDSDQMDKKIGLLLEKQKTKSALKLAIIWTKHDANNPLAWMKLAKLHRLQKKYDAALNALEKAQKLDVDRLDIQESILEIKNLKK